MSVLQLDPAMILAEAARLREDAIKDKTYRLTPIGRLVGRFLRELAFDNYSSKTIENHEHILGHLALDLAHIEPGDVTHDDLKTYLSNRFGELKPNTRRGAVSSVRTFFAWAFDHDHIRQDPARKLRGPRTQDTERRSHSLTTVRQLVVACDERRDRLGLLLLYWCALRRNELRVIQWRHIDLGRRVLTVFGKGGKVLEQNIPEPVALELERFIQDEAPLPDDFLLYPTKVGRRGHYPLYVDEVIWEDRTRPLSISGINFWWRRAVKRAGMEHFPMHELRHTAGTHFHEHGRDLVATQHFLRHANPATTAKTYIHTDRVRTVARVQRDMPDPMEPFSPNDPGSES